MWDHAERKERKLPAGSLIRPFFFVCIIGTKHLKYAASGRDSHCPAFYPVSLHLLIVPLPLSLWPVHFLFLLHSALVFTEMSLYFVCILPLPSSYSLFFPLSFYSFLFFSIHSLNSQSFCFSLYPLFPFQFSISFLCCLIIYSHSLHFFSLIFSTAWSLLTSFFSASSSFVTSVFYFCLFSFIIWASLLLFPFREKAHTSSFTTPFSLNSLFLSCIFFTPFFPFLIFLCRHLLRFSFLFLTLLSVYNFCSFLNFFI